MNLDNTLECSYPFKHWELSECLDNETLNEISFAQILDGFHRYLVTFLFISWIFFAEFLILSSITRLECY